MPFTFAHPAIVLPLNNLKTRWLSLTGLIAGAMVPDFEYFVRMHIYSIYSHTIWGLFWFDIPFGVLLAFLFHNIVRNKLFNNLPSFLNRRLYAYKTFNWNSYFRKYWPVVLYSIFIGACTHMFLDAFTHPAGYFVALFPEVFNKTIIATTPLYKILQHTFTLIGTLYIIYYIRKMPEEQHTNRSISKYWILISICTACIIVLRFWIMPDFQVIANVIISAISAFLLALIIIPQILKTSVSH
ncbi:DUF4184 family protein [Mucilaginibacter kameinonensis]|uniref:DUF4184 family protein n=1 Tax=Mucilaginibacter kameinonensis TaxID=452286 RepID=UPI000EF7B67C|nr:DUF4184 family protein [Mucilaginibacter kameinonensis]